MTTKYIIYVEYQYADDCDYDSEHTIYYSTEVEKCYESADLNEIKQRLDYMANTASDDPDYDDVSYYPDKLELFLTNAAGNEFKYFVMNY